MVKNFKSFNESNQNIDSICKKYGIENYTINDDGTIDVDGDVYLDDLDLVELPLKFRNVNGYFSCSSNKLVTLKGSPINVTSDFFCSNNQLVSLKGAPIKTTSFYCNNNKLKTLNHYPDSSFYDFSGNPIFRWWGWGNINYHSNSELLSKLEIFVDFNINSDDPDDINQEKIDMINSY